jgi:4-hydroxybenzoyl-CoA thioesterase
MHAPRHVTTATTTNQGRRTSNPFCREHCRFGNGTSDDVLASHSPFETPIKVRFGDVDHAGIVYYPRFFQYFHDAFEELIAAAGFDYRQILDVRRLGFPTVKTTCDFVAPVRWADPLTMTVSVVTIGRSSAVLRYRGAVGEQRICEAQITVVCTNLDTFSSVAWPDDLRAMWQGHLERLEPEAP